MKHGTQLTQEGRGLSEPGVPLELPSSSNLKRLSLLSAMAGAV